MTVHHGAESQGRDLPVGVATAAVGSDWVARPRVVARLMARLRAGHLDRLLAAGAFAPEGSALSLYAERIVAFPEREALARALRQGIRDSRDPVAAFMAGRLPVHRANVAAAEATIDALALRLHAPLPVCARGMARLRMVLADGTGPFFQHGRGDLEGCLSAARSAL